MSSLEDEVRAALRAEGERLRSIRPLRLPPPDTRQGVRRAPAGGAPRRVRLGGWLLPALAAAVVVLVAVGLVTVRAIRGGPALSPTHPAPATSRGLILPPLPVTGGTPRYYVSLTGVTDVDNATGLVVGDARTGARLATIAAPKGAVFVGTTPAGAGDDRTFIVGEASQEPKSHPPFATTSPLGWYLLKITPGAPPQVQMTRSPIRNAPADGVVGGTGQNGDMALSADGTKLAVLFTRYEPGKPPAGTTELQALRVYSVSSGRLLGTWHGAAINASNDRLASDLSWVGGDNTVAFALTWGLNSHAELRTLNITAGGTSMQADSHVVWSQYVPYPPHGMYTPSTPRLCTDPFLSADGQAVVCANSTYSARDKRTTLVWLAYPVQAPASPRLLGGVPLPPGKQVSAFASLEWANASGSEVIGWWLTITAGPVKNGNATAVSTTYFAVVGGGTAQRLNTGGYQPAGDDGW